MINTIRDYQFPGEIVNVQDPYYEVFDKDERKKLPGVIGLGDHLLGVDKFGRNKVLDALSTEPRSVLLCFYPDQFIQKNYSNLDLRYARDNQDRLLFSKFQQYQMHPELRYKNFLCSFNGSPHVSRKLLVSILHKFNWFNTEYCSKNFSYSVDILDGHITDYTADQDTYYRKFFISNNSENFFQHINSFGHVRYTHASNIYNLEHRLTESFLHVVSETMATSYYPFVTEKFLYSVVTRGLFLAYAQPGWHDHLERYYGFRRYTKLFDYRFDTIKNPVERLVELMTMISKFSMLSTDDWRDLYEMEIDTIEYNYNHYFSSKYLEQLKKYV